MSRESTAEILIRARECFLPDGFRRGVVVLSDSTGRIRHVGPEEALPPAAAGTTRTLLDAPDCLLIPGLIDLHYPVLHAHSLTTKFSPVGKLLAAAPRLRGLVATGVTTVRDVVGPDDPILDLRDLLSSGEVIGPRLYAAGSPIGAWGRGGAVYGSHEVNGPYEARAAARQQVRRGVDLVSIAVTNGLAGGGGRVNGQPGWQELRDDEIVAAVTEARAAGRHTSANALGAAGVAAAVQAGVTTVEHGTYLDPRTADLMASAGITLVPTLTVMESFALHSTELGVPPHLREPARRVYAAALESVETAKAAGVRIAAGTDTHSDATVHREIALLMGAGLGAAEALDAATGVAGAVLGGDHRVGAITVGGQADLVLLRGRSDDLQRALRDPVTVVQGGHVLTGPGRQADITEVVS